MGCPEEVCIHKAGMTIGMSPDNILYPLNCLSKDGNTVKAQSIFFVVIHWILHKKIGGYCS